MTLQERTSRFIAAEQLLRPGDAVVVALSGGADSSALLAILCELGYRCVAVHCHFGLRGAEADRDMEHSRKLASRLGAEFREVRFDTQAYMREHGVSAEMACRDLRYDFFEKIRRETQATAIAVGHHREDNVETFFLNLLRGSGIHGLRGMLPRRDHIVRPLLNEPKSELVNYLASRGIDYVEDSTNAENDFKRNRLRNVVLPLLEREFPGASDAIVRSLECLRGNEELYNSLLPPMSDSLEGVSPTLLHEWLAPYGFNSSQCRQMLEAQSGAEFVSPTHKLTLCPGRKFWVAADATCRVPTLAQRVIQPPVKFEPGVLCLDADKAQGEFQLRRWREGDRMRPFGMKGTKLVSDILAEAGIPASERKNFYVLTLDDDIIWVPGIRASALYPVTDKTTKILEIRHENN